MLSLKKSLLFKQVTKVYLTKTSISFTNIISNINLAISSFQRSIAVHTEHFSAHQRIIIALRSRHYLKLTTCCTFLIWWYTGVGRLIWLDNNNSLLFTVHVEHLGAHQRIKIEFTTLCFTSLHWVGMLGPQSFTCYLKS